MIGIKLVIWIDRQWKALENPKLFYHYFSNHSHYIIENDIKAENIYNIDEKDFFTVHNQYQRVIFRKDHKNPHCVQYNSQVPVIVIEYICLDETKPSRFVIVRQLNYHIGNLTHVEREIKAKLGYSRNALTNVFSSQVWLKYFEWNIINTDQVDAVNE